MAGWARFVTLNPLFLTGPASLERAMTPGEVLLLLGRRHATERTVVKENKSKDRNPLEILQLQFTHIYSRKRGGGRGAMRILGL